MNINFNSGMIEDARKLVLKYHYSKRFCLEGLIVFCGTWNKDGGLFGDRGEPVAACVFALPAVAWSERVIELQRLVRTDECGIPPLSGLISKCVREIKRRKLCDLLVSYADNTQDHHGGIYQSCSWNYNGKRESKMDMISVEGELIPCRTMNHRYGTHSLRLLKERHGIEGIPHFDKGKYLYWKTLSKSGDEKAARLGLKNIDYPKPKINDAHFFSQ